MIYFTKMKVCFETFGCRLNKAEALQMEADYLAAGWEVTTKHSDANRFVIRCCSVTSRAQAECEKLVAHLKRKYPSTAVAICGCTSHATPLSSHPIPPRPAPIPTRTARAYLKVQDGCAGKCTFCIVPKFRGDSRSEGFANVLDRARRFIDSGYHEIVVTGCNLSLYCSQGKRLPDLVSALADLSPVCRIRLGSLEPGACALETVRAMAAHPNVCRFLHLPVQSGSDKVLLDMRRPYRVRDVDEAVGLATELMPGIGLGCDLMTGFPDESDSDFTATKALLYRLPFSNAHVFPYSRRPGTLAAGLPLQLRKETRTTRTHLLTKIINPKRLAFAKSFVGKAVEVVVEDEKSGRGWTGEYLPCEISENIPVRKSLVRVFVIKVKDGLLVGRPE